VTYFAYTQHLAALICRLLSGATRVAALSVLLYMFGAVPGAEKAVAQTAPVNNCMTNSGGYWNCSQAQALAECKRLVQETMAYRIALYSYPKYTSVYTNRPSANTCAYSYSNATTGRYIVAYEERWDYYSPGYWSPESGGHTYHSIPCTGSSCPAPRIDPAKNLECDTCVAVGNPIHMLTGAKIEKAADFQASNSPLAWRRFYASVAVISDEKQVMGQNWRHGYAHRLLIADTSTTGTVVINRPSGNQYLFTRDGMGAWVTDADVQYKLSPVLESGVRVGWLVKAPDNSEERYNLSGQLVAITYPDASAVSLVYSGGRLSKVQDQQGRTLELTYVGDLLDSVRLPDGKQVKYGYDAQQRLTSVGFQNNDGATPQYDSVTYQYDNASFPNALTGRADEAGGQFASWTYDTSGKAIRSAHAGGVEEVLVSYSSSGATVTNSLGETATHTGQVQLGRAKLTGSGKACVGCGGGFQSRTYDANGYPNQQVDFRNAVTDFDYNARGLVQQRIDAATDTAGRKRTAQTDWHSSFNVPTERRAYDSTGALVGKQTWTYNPRGQAQTASSIDPVSGVVRNSTMSYCELADVGAGACPLLGLVTSVDGPRTDINDIATYTYYPSDDATCASAPTTCPHRKGDLWMVQDALGNITETLKYDGAGRVLSVKDANGVVTDFEYHPRGWLTARKVRGADNGSETDDQITRIDYFPTGLVQKTTLPDGSFTSYTYDAAHRLTDITDGEGNKIHYTLDNAGNRTKEETLGTTGTVLRTLSRVYNQLGQLQTHKDAYDHATGYVYDANGNTDTVTDALSRVTDNDYDPLNRLTKTIQNVGGLNVTTQFKYDAQDNLTEVVDPKNLSTKYTYNGLGDLKRLDSPDTGITDYTYDSAGNRKTQTDARGVTATYGYDALNRLVSVSYPDSSLNVGYSYDAAATACVSGETFAAGRLSLITDGSGSTQYCYDRFGQMVRKVQTTAGQGLTVRYGYTKAGQLSSVSYPDGTVADYVRDGLGRTTQVGVTRPGGSRQILLTSASYYPFGPASEWVFGNGRLFQRTLNQNYQPGVVQDQSAGGLSLGYEFDAVGNLVKLRNGNQGEPPLRRYAYDALNRLTETRDGTTDALLQGYGYDATGNRTSATDGGVNTAYTLAANSHRLTDVGGVARAYDSVGSTTSIGGAAREFVYSDANRMSAVKQGGVIAMSYAYNGKGERVRRSNSTTDELVVYDESGQWLGTYDSTGTPKQQVIWLDGLPVGLVLEAAATNQPLHYIEADALKAPRVVVDSQRNVAVWSWLLTGEAFGVSAPQEDMDGDGTSLVFNLRFPGQIYDSVSGLNYNYYRDYDATVGRYVESDPIGLRGGVSTFSYVSDRPLGSTDRMGLSEFTRAVRGVGLIDTIRADSASDDAEEAAEGSGLPGPISGPQDAYRHCVWSCLMTQRIGSASAKFIGDSHELEGRERHQSQLDEAMDQANNVAGRQCGLMKDKDNCQQRCMRRILDGGLFGPGGVPMPATVPEPPNPMEKYR